MKKVLFILLSVVTTNVFGSNQDSLCDTMSSLNRDSLHMMVSELQRQNRELWVLRDIVEQQSQELETLYNDNRRLFSTTETLKMEVDTLKRISEMQNSAIQVASQDVEERFTKTQRRDALIAVAILAMILLFVTVSYVLFRKSSKNGAAIQKLHMGYEKVSTSCSSMWNDMVKLDGALVQLMEEQLNASDFNAVAQQKSHDLALKVADEIVRIETNLSRMDHSIKGYKQLVRAVERIKTNFLANGYEIVDMLGKSYNDGMKVTANFVTDETLAEGEQIITGIIKPQINYYGRMIQSAQITVNQNL